MVHVPHSLALWKGKAKSDQISKKPVPCKAAPSKAQKGKRKCAASVVQSDAEDSDDESSSEEEEEEMSNSESKGLGSGKDNEPSHLLSSSGTMHSTRCTTMDPNHLDQPEKHIKVAVMAMTNSPQVEPVIQPPSPHPSSPSPVLPSHNSPLPTSALPPVPSPDHTALPGLMMDCSPLSDPKWPMWFSKAFTFLAGRDLGPAWTQAFHQYIKLEHRNGFSIRGPHAGFKKQGQPDEVDWWVGHAHMRSPEIKNVLSFEVKWWTWWKLLQPGWHGVTDVEGPLGPAHRKQATGEDGWSVMDKHSQNVFLTMLATLVWWESGLLGNRQDDSSCHGGHQLGDVTSDGCKVTLFSIIFISVADVQCIVYPSPLQNPLLKSRGSKLPSDVAEGHMFKVRSLP